jgi:RNA polymerase sigma factor (sigma-70 family)
MSRHEWEVGVVRKSKSVIQAPPQSRAPLAQPVDKGTFEDFFRSSYRGLLRVAGYAGASEADAEDAVQQTMIEVCRHWDRVDEPWRWARRAVVNNYRKAMMREAQRLPKSVGGGHVTPAGYRDTAMTAWEDEQWVGQLLEKLPPAQREVMAMVVELWRPVEMAQALGKTPAAIRQNLKLARDRLQHELQAEHEREQAATPVDRPTTREEVK